MDSPLNARFRERLTKREPLLGVLLTLPSPEVAELAALSGFDWLFLDMEHGLLDFEAVQRMVQAVGAICPSIVRVPSNEPVWISKALDSGAAGVIVPHVESGEQAERAARAGKYAPDGARSVGVARAQAFGTRVRESLAHANSETVVIAQAEHIQAAERIDEIVAVPGIDAVFIGPFDLSASLGRPGDIVHPEVQSAIARIRGACAAHEMPLGIFVVDTGAAREAFVQGLSLVCLATDTLLLGEALREVVRRARL